MSRATRSQSQIPTTSSKKIDTIEDMFNKFSNTSIFEIIIESTNRFPIFKKVHPILQQIQTKLHTYNNNYVQINQIIKIITDEVFDTWQDVKYQGHNGKSFLKPATPKLALIYIMCINLALTLKIDCSKIVIDEYIDLIKDVPQSEEIENFINNGMIPQLSKKPIVNFNNTIFQILHNTINSTESTTLVSYYTPMQDILQQLEEHLGKYPNEIQPTIDKFKLEDEIMKLWQDTNNITQNDKEFLPHTKPQLNQIFLKCIQIAKIHNFPLDEAKIQNYQQMLNNTSLSTTTPNPTSNSTLSSTIPNSSSSPITNIKLLSNQTTTTTTTTTTIDSSYSPSSSTTTSHSPLSSTATPNPTSTAPTNNNDNINNTPTPSSSSTSEVQLSRDQISLTETTTITTTIDSTSHSSSLSSSSTTATPDSNLTSSTNTDNNNNSSNNNSINNTSTSSSSSTSSSTSNNQSLHNQSSSSSTPTTPNSDLNTSPLPSPSPSSTTTTNNRESIDNFLKDQNKILPKDSSNTPNNNSQPTPNNEEKFKNEDKKNNKSGHKKDKSINYNNTNDNQHLSNNQQLQLQPHNQTLDFCITTNLQHIDNIFQLQLALNGRKIAKQHNKKKKKKKKKINILINTK